MPHPPEHPHLSGNYAPVSDETSIDDLRVDGTIPPGLQGRYVRIGPNPIGSPARPYVWSEADGMVHAVTIHPGRAPSYRNRWVLTERASRLLGTEPIPGLREDVADPANAIIVAVGNRLVVLGEHACYELGADLETRRCIGVVTNDPRPHPRPATYPHNSALWVHPASTASHCVAEQLITDKGDAVGLTRWTIDLLGGSIRRDLPNPASRSVRQMSVGVGRPSARHVYSISHEGDMPFDGTEIVKYDLVTGGHQRRDLGAGRHPGEFLFVGDPARLDREDGGWLVGFVHDDRTALAELVILDAGDITSPAIATIHTTRRVPYGMHGLWAPSRSTHK